LRQGFSPSLVRKSVQREARFPAGDVLHDDGDGVRVLVEGGVELIVGHLLDGPIRQALVGLESVDDGCHEFGGDVHARFSVATAVAARADDQPVAVVLWASRVSLATSLPFARSTCKQGSAFPRCLPFAQRNERSRPGRESGQGPLKRRKP
jgi:hypothetical protein